MSKYLCVDVGVFMLLVNVVSSDFCGVDEGCLRNRECFFGSGNEDYEIVRDALFSATGYGRGCIDECSCEASSDNVASRLLDEAMSNATIYGNNELCESGAIVAAMK